MPEVVSCRKRRKLLPGSEKTEEKAPLSPPGKKQRREQDPTESNLPSSPLKSSTEKIFFGLKDADKLAENDLCLVRLRDDPYQPLGIMRFLSRGENASLTMQL